MKTIKIILLSLVASCTMASCDFLEKEPQRVLTANYFKTQVEAASFLTGIYATLGQSPFYGSDYMALAGGDDLGFYGGSTGRISNIGLICNNATTSDTGVYKQWLNLYSGIERANLFLEQIDAVPDMPGDIREQYRSEARFLRAFYYFHLVQGWGDVPFKIESTYASGSVYNKNIARTDKNVIYRFIVKEMEEAADNGLLSAQKMSYKPGRISKSAAWGILARVYLFWAGEHNRDEKQSAEAAHAYFERASFFGQKVMGEGHGLAKNYWDVFIDLCSNQYNTTAKESIWEVEFAGDGTGDTRGEGRIGNNMGLICPDYSSLSSIVGKSDPGYAYGFIWSTPKLYELYQNNGDKERFTWNIASFSYRGIKGEGVVGRTFVSKDMYDLVVDNPEWSDARSYSYDGVDKGKVYVGGTTPPAQYGDVYQDASKTTPEKLRKDLCCAKYRREYEPAMKKNKSSTSINFPLLRYSDVLLMIAEAENEYYGGPTELAKKCLKEVRDRVGIEDITFILTSQDKFREAIKNERAMELCFEYTRRFDLIRWGDFVKNMNEQAVRAQSGLNWTQGTQVAPFFNVTSTYLYYPIPDSERAVNNLITENNPGW